MKTGMSARSNLSMRAILLALCCVVTMALSGLNVSAAGTTTLALSSSTPKQGETVTLTVTASDSASITVKYTNAVLQLKSCNVDYTADGNAISFTAKSATIVYDTISTGKANIIVSSSVLTGSSAVVNVQAGDGTVAVDTTAADANATDATTDTSTEQTDQATADTTTEGDSSPFVLSCTNDTITLSTPDSLFSENLVEATLNVGDASYDAYKYGTLDSEFYYVYGTDAAGITDWFQYDSNTGVLQRANRELITFLEGKVDSAAATKSSGTILGFPAVNVACVLILIIVILIVLIINMVIRRREDDDYVFGDSDEDDEEDEEKAQPRRGFLNRKPAEKDDEDEAEDDEDDEDDEEEENDDEEDEKPRRGLFSRLRRDDDYDDEEDEEDEEDEDNESDYRDSEPVSQDTIVIPTVKKDSDGVKVRHYEPKSDAEQAPKKDADDFEDPDPDDDELPEDDGDLNDFWGEKAAKKKERKKLFSKRKADDYDDDNEDDYKDDINGDFDVIDLNDL